MACRIRAESAADAALVRALLEAAFPTDAEGRLVDALRESGGCIVALVAEVAGRVLGHIAFTPVLLDPPGDPLRGAGLAPVAVHPDHQRRGIGSALVREGISRCAALGLDFVVVLGDPGYYGRFGFRRASAKGLTNEYGADAEFGVLELRRDCLAGRRALVSYAPEFGSTGT